MSRIAKKIQICRDDGEHGRYVIIRGEAIKHEGFWLNCAASFTAEEFEKVTGQKMKPGTGPVDFRLVRIQKRKRKK